MKFCSVKWLTLLLLLVVDFAYGYPNGAPRNHKTCKTLKPHHKGAHPQTSSPPYSVTPAKAKIPIGGSLNVTISAHSGTFYKGFIMQARPRMIDNVNYIHPIGTFKILDASHSKTLDCLSQSDNTVTHTNPEQKTSTSFIWTPPAKYKGPVYFRASFVKDFNTFWVNVSSKVVVGDTVTVDPMWLEADPAEADSSSSSSESESAEGLLDFNPEIYQACGLTKACFGLPENCVSTASCEVIASVIAKDSKFEFELLGLNVKYVSILLSETGQISVDSMTTCAFVNSRVKLLHSYNEYQVDGSQLDNSDETLINSSYVDGMLYCKFVRDEMIELNSVYFDLKNKQYFLILAAGNVRNEKEIINLEKMQFHVSARKNFLSDVSGFSQSTDSNYLANKSSWFQIKLRNWFFGVFDYFLMVR